MNPIEFSWDKRKAAANLSKHKISFEEAKSAFIDPNARLIHDPDHSKSEDRFILLGLSSYSKLLTVCHCYIGKGDVIRIFSARKSTRNEQKQYGRFLL